MKFLICLTLVICGAYGVLSADTTTATPNSLSADTTTATPNSIPDGLKGLDQLEKDLKQQIVNATKGLGDTALNGTDSLNGSGASSGFLTPILNLISSTVQNVINGISKPILQAIDNLISSIKKQLSDQITKVSNLTTCANINNSSLNIEEPLTNLMKCAEDSLNQATQPVEQAVQLINKIGLTLSTDIGNALKCATTPIFIFPNILCFVNAGFGTVLHGFSTFASVTRLGVAIVNNILTIIPNNIQCSNDQFSAIVQSFIDTGANVTECLS